MSEDKETHDVSHNDCEICRKREQAELDRIKAQQSRWVQRCIMFSECLNRLRVIPRAIVAGYGWGAWLVISWFMTLEAPDTQQAALVTTIAALAPAIFGFYMQGGISGGSGKSGAYNGKR